MLRAIPKTIGMLAPLVVACSSSESNVGGPIAPSDLDSGLIADALWVDTSPSDAPIAMSDAASLDSAASSDAGDASDAESDAGIACAWSGAPGQCITVSACSALSDHTSYSGECPGPATIECCIKTPSTSDNPPISAGYHLMPQSQVTPDMTAWAVAILNDPATYPMFATATKTFGSLAVLARVEWHPPDFQNGAVHRGVTLYVQ